MMLTLNNSKIDTILVRYQYLIPSRTQTGTCVLFIRISYDELTPFLFQGYSIMYVICVTVRKHPFSLERSYKLSRTHC